MCQHQPPCPSGTDANGQNARIVTSHPEQGWYLLCNGVVLFDDGGLMLSDHRVVAPVYELVAA
ncbi:DUF5999 family protein [Saccharothrix deserti]|uniref:DUF5999 family protein n=1 Tax=Saccharothrix deserti TaxID=2593674 RepID=UPI00131B6899|nr:DUF5999 family protein [Saccharothrix deserti]